MSRFLSRIGIGAATVETRLPEGAFTPGQTVEATIEIDGGRSEQPIDELYLVLLARVGDQERVVAEFKTAESTTVPAGESLTITTDLTIPSWTPITRGDSKVWLKTGLDVSWAVEPSDEEDLEIVPGPYVEGLFAAVDELGFDYRGSELREPAWLEDQPFVQAFTFGPTTERYRADIDDLTFVCHPREEDLKTVVEIDEKEPAEEFAEVAYDKQEIVHVFETTNEDMLRRQLESLLAQYTHT
jgi:sporulation-control protein